MERWLEVSGIDLLWEVGSNSANAHTGLWLCCWRQVLIRAGDLRPLALTASDRECVPAKWYSVCSCSRLTDRLIRVLWALSNTGCSGRTPHSDTNHHSTHLASPQCSLPSSPHRRTLLSRQRRESRHPFAQHEEMRFKCASKTTAELNRLHCGDQWSSD